MLPFMGFSAFFLIQAINAPRHQIKNLMASLIFLTIAFAIHNSVFAWMSVFVFLALSILKKIKASKIDYLKIFLSGLVTFIILYLPTFYSQLLPQKDFKFISNNLDITSQDYSHKLLENIILISQTLNLNNSIALILISFLIIFYFWQKNFKDSNKLILLFILTILPIICASFFNKIRVHYLILSFPPLVLLISRFITLQKNKLVIHLFTIIFFIIISSNLMFLKNITSPLQNQTNIDEISSTLISELKDVKRINGYNDFSFFQIRSYAMDSKIFEYPVLDTILINPLEKKLNTKLAIISDKSYFNHIQTGKLEYILVACHKFKLEIGLNGCLREFFLQFPSYFIQKNLYNSFSVSIYLAKKND